MQARLMDLLPRLNERDRRVAMAIEPKSWGRGGISAVQRATGASRSTIRRGLDDLADDASEGSDHRVRAPGGGRKKAEVTDPELVDALDTLIEPETRGDPESPLRWTTKSTRNLAAELTEMGHAVSHSVVAKILRSLKYSLQGTRKTLEGRQHPDRDAQFRYINTLAGEFLASGDPVISVDTKKKELVGRYSQAGQEWHPQGEPVEVSTYDFPSQADGKAIPYGVYDLTENSAWVSVGIDHDTSVFAVATIDKWWQQMGKEKYPDARRILITADGGGSNGHRPWLWKFELARLAKATGLDITVCHYPPGTSSRVGDWRGCFSSEVGPGAFMFRRFPSRLRHPTDHGTGPSLRFQPPPPRSGHAVLPHPAHRRCSPAAFGFPRQSRKGLGATTFPARPTSPRWFAAA